MTVASPEPDEPQFTWPWDIVMNDDLSLAAVRKIVAALTDWLRVSDDGTELGIAHRIAEVNGRNRFILAIRDTRAELRDRGFADFGLAHVKELMDQVWVENGWRNPYKGGR